jgi:SAM-dependent methyltransferase
MTIARVAVPAERVDDLSGPYDHLSATERYIHTSRDRALLELLRRHGIELSLVRAIEIGCGAGSLMRTLCYCGADSKRLTGIDLRAAAVRQARTALPDAAVAAADAARLPFASDAFDLALAFTSLSSMLDQGARRRAAAEALRVLRPGGLLIVYDFWINPTNRRVHPVREAELRALFTPRSVEIQRVTLAPPIVRLLGGRPALCATLECLAFLRTHLLAAVRKEP